MQNQTIRKSSILVSDRDVFGLSVESSVVLSAELHAHSALSYDGRDPVSLLLQQAKAVGLDAIAITDHDEIQASLDAVSLAEDYGLIGIPATEVSSKAGHILALGVENQIPKGRPFAETIEQIRSEGGIAVVPHPFQKSRNGVGPHISTEALASVDAIEVYNSRLLTGRGNRQARKFAETHELPMTAGSDAHISEMVGQAVTGIDTAETNVESIIEAIRDGRTVVEGKRTPWHISFRQAAGGVKRRVQNRLDNWL